MSAVTSLLGFEVLEACDGLQCIDVYNQERTQLVCIFLDLQMPVADGYTAAAGIRALESREPGGPGGEAAPRVPVVVCTASCLDDPAEGGPAGQTVAQRALALGADGAVAEGGSG
ncbi:Hybrid signal transduction histidine kinase I [Tetrabaena socialis]|uniref:Hybrid signal transduction histidine kinase I n=1 Tax=Tetrabaena socialis TaxID=47790 RepID=A0A2J7ZKS6_9CHLO|nr:Hybrid signal transduction histidine kinase I [Tetrabaena socialis]|eukprot:PNH00879.1 Hybrid signal transduction histidine kinase I [Tetrabaena socialis]